MENYGGFIKKVLLRWHDLPDHERTIQKCKEICGELWLGNPADKAEVWYHVQAKTLGRHRSRPPSGKVDDRKFKRDLKALREKLAEIEMEKV